MVPASKKVVINYTSDNMDLLYVFDEDRRAVCTAEAKVRTPFRNTTEALYIRYGRISISGRTFCFKYACIEIQFHRLNGSRTVNGIFLSLLCKLVPCYKAHRVMFHHSVISQFLNQSYKGNNEEVARTVLQYLDMARLQNIKAKHSCFYEGMHNTRAVLFASFRFRTACRADMVRWSASSMMTSRPVSLKYSTRSDIMASFFPGSVLPVLLPIICRMEAAEDVHEFACRT